MSLISQLRIAVLIILTLTAGGNFILTTLSSQQYFTEQLQSKNIDNAVALALSMSQLQKEATTLNLLVSAQFDSGHYQYISLFDINDKLIAERKNTYGTTKAPQWFTNLIPLKVYPGIARVQDGWKQYATLKLEGDLNLVYDKLWVSTLNTGIFTILIGLISYYLCGYFLKKILRPLENVIQQAKRIEDHKFITIDEPKTLEFRALVSAMNSLSNLVKKMLNDESIRLEELSKKINLDPVTGLMRRDYFIDNIQSSTHHEDSFNGGALIVFRLLNLADIDKALDYKKTNALLKKLADCLLQACKKNPALIACRLKGAEFAIFSNQTINELMLANQLKNTLEEIIFIEDIGVKANFIALTRKVNRFDNATNLITLVNDILNSSRKNDDSSEFIINANDMSKIENTNLHEANLANWELMLNNALSNGRLKLENYPVVSSKNKLLHSESYVRIQLNPDDKWLSAAEFMFWATQLNLIDKIDELVLESAITVLNENPSPLCIHVSSQAMLSDTYIKKAKKIIKKLLKNPNQLCFEINEATAFNHIEEFRHFCDELKMLGCIIGIEHISQHIARLSELNDISLDYIKVNSIHIHELNTNKANQELLSGICTVAHSMGLLAIAEGVSNDSEIESLIGIGIDGMTGPAIKLPFSD